MKRNIFLLSLMSIGCCLFLCFKSSKYSDNVEESKNEKKIARRSNLQQDDKSHIVFLTIESPSDSRYKDIFKALKNKNAMNDIVEDFNNTIKLPNDIEVIFSECDEENAFYNPETKKITVCYELIRKYVDLSDQKISLSEKIQQATTFSMLHELGHALVDQLEIPITGKEENAVDEFALMMLLDSDNDKAIDNAVEGVLQFYYDSLDEENVNLTDVHAPNKERYFDLLTLYIGSNEIADMKSWIGNEEDQLSPERAEGARAEYQQKRNSWDKLLREFYKK